MKKRKVGQDCVLQEEMRIAYHEAGHTVMFIHYDLRFNWVKILGDSGEVNVDSSPFNDPTIVRNQDDVSQWQQICVAGAAAEQIVFGKPLEYGSRDDRRRHQELEQKNPSRIRGRDGWNHDIALAKKNLNIEYIRKVAEELHKTKYLHYEQVHNVLGLRLPWDS
jgi:hypothetical protein